MSRREILLLALSLMTAAACGPKVFAGGELDRLEAVLAPTALQRPAWQAFRREAEAAETSWRRDLRGILGTRTFDAQQARAAADSAHRDTQRLIAAWQKVDETLTPAQRAALRRANAL